MICKLHAKDNTKKKKKEKESLQESLVPIHGLR